MEEYVPFMSGSAEGRRGSARRQIMPTFSRIVGRGTAQKQNLPTTSSWIKTRKGQTRREATAAPCPGGQRLTSLISQLVEISIDWASRGHAECQLLAPLVLVRSTLGPNQIGELLRTQMANYLVMLTYGAATTDTLGFA